MGSARRRQHERDRRRDAARARVDGRRWLAGCPEVGKPGYDLSDDDEARLAVRRGGPDLTLVPCRCGFYHYHRS